jgi:hypothetical protein
VRSNHHLSSTELSSAAAFQTLERSLSLQVFKINANVQGILKLVGCLGTDRDNTRIRKTLSVWRPKQLEEEV